MPTSNYWGSNTITLYSTTWGSNTIATSGTTRVTQLMYPGGAPPKDINEFLKMALIDESIGRHYYYV